MAITESLTVRSKEKYFPIWKGFLHFSLESPESLGAVDHPVDASLAAPSLALEVAPAMSLFFKSWPARKGARGRPPKAQLHTGALATSSDAQDATIPSTTPCREHVEDKHLDMESALHYVCKSDSFGKDVAARAALFRMEHPTVHHGLPGFDGVLQAPDPGGVCYVLEAWLPQAPRIVRAMVGTYTMLCVHASTLSQVAQDESGTYMSLPMLIDRITLEELVPHAFLEGMLPRPECLHACPQEHADRHHASHGATCPLLPNGYSYNAWLQWALNEQWRGMLKGECPFTTTTLIDMLLRWAMAAFMAYCPVVDWERCWGGAWGGNIHATKWLRGRLWSSLQLELGDARVGYGDAPCLSIRGKCRVPCRDGPGQWEHRMVNAMELQHWLAATGCNSFSRAQFRLRCFVAWRLMLTALHPSTIVVLDCTSWWCHAPYLLLDKTLGEALELVRSPSSQPRNVAKPEAYEDPLRKHPTVLLDYRETRGSARGNAGTPSAWVGLHAIRLQPHASHTPLITMHMIKGSGAEGHMLGNGGDREDPMSWHDGTAADFVAKVAHGMEAMGCKWEGAPHGPTPSAPPPLAFVRDALGGRRGEADWVGDLQTPAFSPFISRSPRCGKRSHSPLPQRSHPSKKCPRASFKSDWLEAAVAMTGPRRITAKCVVDV